jgi:hypothetical protein
MIRLTLASILALLSASAPLFGQAPTAANTWDSQLAGLERELLPLIEAMPPAKMSFAPSAGEFRNVRTFGRQATHTATVLYMVAAAILNEPVPVEVGPADNGPASLQAKAGIVKYVKDAFAYAHKAMNSLTNENQMGLVKSAFGDHQTTRLYMASVAIWHSYDHYGQMVVYARMCGIIPPASR